MEGDLNWIFVFLQRDRKHQCLCKTYISGEYLFSTDGSIYFNDESGFIHGSNQESSTAGKAFLWFLWFLVTNTMEWGRISFVWQQIFLPCIGLPWGKYFKSIRVFSHAHCQAWPTRVQIDLPWTSCCYCGFFWSDWRSLRNLRHYDEVRLNIFINISLGSKWQMTTTRFFD